MLMTDGWFTFGVKEGLFSSAKNESNRIHEE
jgi:hypothetical protein